MPRSARIRIPQISSPLPLLSWLSTQQRDINYITRLLITLSGSQIPGRASKALPSLPYAPANLPSPSLALPRSALLPVLPASLLTYLLRDTKLIPARAVPSIWMVSSRWSLRSDHCSNVKSLEKPSLSVVFKIARTLAYTLGHLIALP